jgi:hypothetical protein
MYGRYAFKTAVRLGSNSNEIKFYVSSIIKCIVAIGTFSNTVPDRPVCAQKISIWSPLVTGHISRRYSVSGQVL